MHAFHALLLAVLVAGLLAHGKDTPPPPPPLDTDPASMIANAISDDPQLKTMAFDGLAFMTGNFNLDTFMPPGKVSDYWGFQYMRDTDAVQLGHNTDFLTKIASSVLSVLTDAQINEFKAYASSTYDNSTLFAKQRFPLMLAFRQNMEGTKPTNAKALLKGRVQHWSGSTLYRLDGHLAFQHAQVLANVILSLSQEQKAALARYKFADSSSWDLNNDVIDRIKQQMRDVPEGAPTVMGLAGDMFSWMNGNTEIDTYFCPERHAMYFGGFGMKTLPAHGQQNYTIPSGFTADGGVAFMSNLTVVQRAQLTTTVTTQKSSLTNIVSLRRKISTELRKLLTGETASYDVVISTSVLYGKADGYISYLYDKAFTAIWASLTPAQHAYLTSLRTLDPKDPTGPFIYAQEVSSTTIGSTDYFFGL